MRRALVTGAAGFIGANLVRRLLADVTRRVLEIPEEPEWGSYQQRTWDTSIWVGDPSRAAELLGWRACIDFESGFRATAEWARATGWPARLLPAGGSREPALR